MDPPRMCSVGLGITSMNQGHGNLCVSIPGAHPHAFFNEIRRIPIGDFSNFENASLPVLKIEFFHGGWRQNTLIPHTNKAVFKTSRTEGVEAADCPFLIEFFPVCPQLTAIRGRDRLSINNFKRARASVVARLRKGVSPVGQGEEIAIGLYVSQTLAIVGGIESHPAIGGND